MGDEIQDVMDHAVALARRAGEMVRKAVRDEGRSVMTKSSNVDLVTQTDQKVEQLIIESVKERFPKHRVIGEESVAAAISIGVCFNKRVEVGVVYSCLEDHMYTARRGKGAFCDGRPLQVSDQKDIKQSIILTEFGSNRDPEVVDKIFISLRKVLTLPVHGIRGAGTAALNMCLVASGSAEAYYEIGIHVWDIAAGSLIVSEAGGVLMDVEGGPLDMMSRRVVAANNQSVAETLVKQLEYFSPKRDDAAP